jgi:type I restriction enzyme S subunit
MGRQAAQVMDEVETVKPGWASVKFGEVVKLSKARCSDPEAEGIERYVGLEHIDSDDLRIRRWGLVEEGTTFTTLFKPGQVLFGKRRAYLRKVAVADFEGICSGDIYVFESADPKELLPELLPFICQTERFFEYAIGTSAGSLSPRTNWKSLVNFEFALPSLEEQKKLVGILSASKKSFEMFEVALRNIQLLRVAMIDELCQSSDGINIQLGDICKMQNGRAFPSKNYQETGILLLRPGNLGADGYMNWNSDKTVCLDPAFEKEASDYLIQPGDIVINLTAQSLEDGFMGRVCLARQDDRSLLNQRIGRFVFTSKDVVPEFLFRVLQSSDFQQHAISMCEGTKVKHLFWSHLERFNFRLPSIGYQKQATAKLKQIDEAVASLIRKVEQQRQLHFRLMNELIEPASNRGQF